MSYNNGAVMTAMPRRRQGPAQARSTGGAGTGGQLVASGETAGGKDEGGRMKDEVLILPLKLKAGMGVSARKVETREQAELRRERVESITRRAPEVVITRRWIHTASHFDGQEAVVVKLPWLQRLRNWMLDAGI